MQKSETKRLAIDLSKTIKHHFPDFYGQLSGIKDPRKHKHYKIEEIVFGAVSLFLFKTGSRNEYENKLGEGSFRSNIKKLFGIKIPSTDAVADVLKQVDTDRLEEIKSTMAGHLIKKKVFEKWRYNGKFMVAIDGTGISSYKKRHCEHCLHKTYNKGKDNEKTVYYHNVLEAKLVTANGFSISLCTVWIENPDGEYNKQDCERKAFERLAGKLKAAFPRTGICICADGLYPYDGFFTICKSNNWDYIATLKEKSLKQLWKEIRLINRECLLNGFSEGPMEIRQQIQWIENHEFAGHTHNWIQIKEKQTNGKGEQKEYKFVYLTNLATNHGTAIDICNNGRLRWKIEKQGFDQQKNHGYNICHKYCRKSYQGMKNYYQCCQIAHIINQLLELTKKFKDRLIHKKTIKHLWDCLRAFMMMGSIDETEVQDTLAYKTQIRYVE